jgi:hypothetical protein
MLCYWPVRAADQPPNRSCFLIFEMLSGKNLLKDVRISGSLTRKHAKALKSMLAHAHKRIDGHLHVWAPANQVDKYPFAVSRSIPWPSNCWL